NGGDGQKPADLLSAEFFAGRFFLVSVSRRPAIGSVFHNHTPSFLFYDVPVPVKCPAAAFAPPPASAAGRKTKRSASLPKHPPPGAWRRGKAPDTRPGPRPARHGAPGAARRPGLRQPDGEKSDT